MTTSLSELRRLARAATADWSGPYTSDDLRDTGEFTVGTAALFAAVSPSTILALLDITEAARALVHFLENDLLQYSDETHIDPVMSLAHAQRLDDLGDALRDALSGSASRCSCC